jgi:hypothetical protein
MYVFWIISFFTTFPLLLKKLFNLLRDWKSLFYSRGVTSSNSIVIVKSRNFIEVLLGTCHIPRYNQSVDTKS